MTPSSPPGAEMTDSQVELLTDPIASENLPGPHIEVGTASGMTLARYLETPNPVDEEDE